MIPLTAGELGLVLFIFGLTWGAGVLPRLGERLGARAAGRRTPPSPKD
jgi:hypothetical protein